MGLIILFAVVAVLLWLVSNFLSKKDSTSYIIPVIICDVMIIFSVMALIVSGLGMISEHSKAESQSIRDEYRMNADVYQYAVSSKYNSEVSPAVVKLLEYNTKLDKYRNYGSSFWFGWYYNSAYQDLEPFDLSVLTTTEP